MLAAIVLLQLAVRGLDDLITAVGKTLTAIVASINAKFASLDTAIALTQIIQKLDVAAENSALQAMYTALINSLYKEHDATVNWVETLIGVEDTTIDSLSAYLRNEIADLRTQEQVDINNINTNITVNVIGGMGGQLLAILKWIATEGAYMFNLLTHLDQLAALIGEYLLGSWLGLLSRFAKPFFKWLYMNAIQESPTFASILEDVISSLFD